MFKLMGAYTFNKSLINFDGLKFIKLLGTGSKDGFSVIPDFSSYVMITSWKNEGFRKEFINKNIDKNKILFDHQKPNSLVANIDKLQKEIIIKNV